MRQSFSCSCSRMCFGLWSGAPTPPACDFSIDLVCQQNGVRVAIECDGERYHTDERGRLKMEDLERQAILERAEWRVVRVPYRKWIRDSGREIQRILSAVVAEVELPEQDERERTGRLNKPRSDYRRRWAACS